MSDKKFFEDRALSLYERTNALLEDIEFPYFYNRDGSDFCCPKCYNDSIQGHRQDCELMLIHNEIKKELGIE